MTSETNNTNNTMDNAGGFDNSAYALGLCGRANTLPGCGASTMDCRVTSTNGTGTRCGTAVCMSI